MAGAAKGASHVLPLSLLTSIAECPARHLLLCQPVGTVLASNSGLQQGRPLATAAAPALQALPVPAHSLVHKVDRHWAPHFAARVHAARDSTPAALPALLPLQAVHGGEGWVSIHTARAPLGSSHGHGPGAWRVPSCPGPCLGSVDSCKVHRLPGGEDWVGAGEALAGEVDGWGVGSGLAPEEGGCGGRARGGQPWPGQGRWWGRAAAARGCDCGCRRELLLLAPRRL